MNLENLELKTSFKELKFENQELKNQVISIENHHLEENKRIKEEYLKQTSMLMSQKSNLENIYNKQV